MDANRLGDNLVAIGSAAHERPYRLLAGIAVSLVLHAALLFAYRQHLARAAPADELAPTRTIAVWLRPLEPAKPVQYPKPVKAAKLRELVKAPPASRRDQDTRPPVARAGQRGQGPARELIAVPDRTPAQPEPPDVFSVEPQDKPGGGAPKFDREAALRVARAMADDPDPAQANTAVGQIPPKPYATETKLARAISRAKRRDCKDGLPGGLLGPLILLMDKKDSGCKW